MRFLFFIIIITLTLFGKGDIYADRYEERGDADFFFSQMHRNFAPIWTLWSDDSIVRFVTKKIPLNDKNYAPDDLIALSGSSVEQAWRNSYLRKPAHEALDRMGRDFRTKFGTPLVVVSGYRSASYQQRLWDLGRCTDTLCAPPGYSEHQLGLAIDVFDATTASDYMKNALYKKYITWIQAHAHKYGYTQSYQKWPSVDGYDIEPWHWRYVWIDLATKLRNLGMTYSEYIEFESMREIFLMMQ